MRLLLVVRASGCLTTAGVFAIDWSYPIIYHHSMQHSRQKEGRVLKDEERLSLREAADALGVSEVTARRWVKAGKLKAYQPGRKYLVPRGAIDELLESESGKVRAPSSQEKLFNNGGLEEERRARYQLSWRDYITLKANQIASQADDKGYAPEWM